MAHGIPSQGKVTITVDEYSSNPTQAFTHYNINQSRFQPPHVHMWVFPTRVPACVPAVCLPVLRRRTAAQGVGWKLSNLLVSHWSSKAKWLSGFLPGVSEDWEAALHPLLEVAMPGARCRHLGGTRPCSQACHFTDLSLTRLRDPLL